MWLSRHRRVKIGNVGYVPHAMFNLGTAHSNRATLNRKSSRSSPRRKAKVSYKLQQDPIRRPDPQRPLVVHHLEHQHHSRVCRSLHLHCSSHHKPAGLPPSVSGRRNPSPRQSPSSNPHLLHAASSESGRIRGCRCLATFHKGLTVRTVRSLSSGEPKQGPLACGRDRSRRRVWYVIFRSHSHGCLLGSLTRPTDSRTATGKCKCPSNSQRHMHDRG